MEKNAHGAYCMFTLIPTCGTPLLPVPNKRSVLGSPHHSTRHHIPVGHPRDRPEQHGLQSTTACVRPLSQAVMQKWQRKQLVKKALASAERTRQLEQLLQDLEAEREREEEQEAELQRATAEWEKLLEYRERDLRQTLENDRMELEKLTECRDRDLRGAPDYDRILIEELMECRDRDSMQSLANDRIELEEWREEQERDLREKIENDRIELEAYRQSEWKWRWQLKIMALSTSIVTAPQTIRVMPRVSPTGVLRVTGSDFGLQGTVLLSCGGVLAVTVFCALTVACYRACDMWEIPLCRGSYTHPVCVPVESRRLPVD